jgi:hypothetical protein
VSEDGRPEQARARTETVVGVALVSLGLLAAAGSMRIAPDYDGSTTARIFPLITAGAIVLLGALSLRDRRAAPPPEKDDGSRERRWLPLALIVLAFGYLWAIGKVGYLLSTAVAAPAALWLFGIRHPGALALSALLCPAGYHLVFFELLGAFPPLGLWFDPLLAIRY